MRRVVVLAALLFVVWLARDARWLQGPALLRPASPHDAYLASLEESGAAATPLASRWIEQGARAVAEPARVELPHQRAVPFRAHDPISHGFRVNLRRGQRLDVVARVDGPSPAAAFVDIFAPQGEERERRAPVLRAGGIRATQYEAIDEAEEVVVRVQPELLREGRLHVALRAVPALRFPVAQGRARDLQSGFGSARDGGTRSHEGVDIFARRGTPVISATDGVVTRVTENGRGGRVVWVWDPSRGLMLYYAHLNEQLVLSGERVAAGDVLGTVGNTGNARTTAPHLHFGLYARGRGAIDPRWFIVPPAG